LAEKLKNARQKARLTQAQLAERLGVSQATVANWESGSGKRPSKKRSKQLSILLGVPEEEILAPDGEVSDFDAFRTHSEKELNAILNSIHALRSMIYSYEPESEKETSDKFANLPDARPYSRSLINTILSASTTEFGVPQHMINVITTALNMHDMIVNEIETESRHTHPDIHYVRQFIEKYEIDFTGDPRIVEE